MLMIETTPNLYGIKLIGDYQDLNALYDSLSRYLDFYERNNESYPYHEYEFLLSLNYDIRHAYMGDRGIETKENNADRAGAFAEELYELPEKNKKEFADLRNKYQHGNLYFSVEILYPLVFHYMIALEEIISSYTFQNWFEKPPFDIEGYSQIDANYDKQQILAFTSLLWKNVSTVLGNEKAMVAREYYEDSEIFLVPYVFTEGLAHWQMANYHKLSEEEKLCCLTAMLYEIMDSEGLKRRTKAREQARSHYKEALEKIKKEEVKEFPRKSSFYKKLDRFLTGKEKFYRDDFDRFLEKTYGVVEDEDPKM